MIRPSMARLLVLLNLAGICCVINRGMGLWVYILAVVFFAGAVIVAGIECRYNKKLYGSMFAPIANPEQIRGVVVLLLAILIECITFANLYFDTGRAERMEDCKQILEMKEMDTMVVNTTVLMPSYYVKAVEVYCNTVLLMDDIKDCMNEVLLEENQGYVTTETQEWINSLMEKAGTLEDDMLECKHAMIYHIVIIAMNTVMFLMSKFMYYGYIFVKPIPDKQQARQKKKKK